MTTLTFPSLGPVVQVLEEKEEFTFEFLVDEIPVGLERALGHMTEKERAVVQLAPRQAFGAEGNPRLNVPPDSDVVYDVTLKSIQNPPPKWKLSFQERRSLALKLKEEGNGHFKQGLSERLVRVCGPSAHVQPVQWHGDSG